MANIMNINARFESEVHLNAKFETSKSLNANFGSISFNPSLAPSYKGDTDVTPSLLDEITLLTNGKMMNSDVTVHVLPVYRTSNESGGTTVYLGRKVNG